MCSNLMAAARAVIALVFRLGYNYFVLGCVRIDSAYTDERNLSTHCDWKQRRADTVMATGCTSEGETSGTSPSTLSSKAFAFSIESLISADDNRHLCHCQQQHKCHSHPRCSCSSRPFQDADDDAVSDVFMMTSPFSAHSGTCFYCEIPLKSMTVQ